MSYFETHAQEYSDSTLNVDMSILCDIFITNTLPIGNNIVDAGCGSGRDSLYFLNRSFDVYSFDSSKSMCDVASKNIGQNVHCHKFTDLPNGQYAGIWACASLLFVEPSKLKDTINHLIDCLKLGGCLFISLKRGNSHLIKNGITHYHYTNAHIHELYSKIKHRVEMTHFAVSVSKIDKTNWFNIFLKKVDD